MGRYSIPQCQAYGVKGDVCHPRNSEPMNMTVGYPDTNLVELTNVYRILCPCANGYVCNDQNTCHDPAEDLESDNLH